MILNDEIKMDVPFDLPKNIVRIIQYFFLLLVEFQIKIAQKSHNFLFLIPFLLLKTLPMIYSYIFMNESTWGVKFFTWNTFMSMVFNISTLYSCAIEKFHLSICYSMKSMYCQLLQEKRAIHAHRDVLAWNQNIRFEKKPSSIQLLLH